MCRYDSYAARTTVASSLLFSAIKGSLLDPMIGENVSERRTRCLKDQAPKEKQIVDIHNKSSLLCELNAMS